MANDFSLRSYVLSSSLLGRSSRAQSYLFSLKNVCTQICYNGRGGANSLVLISPPHKPCDLFWLCPVDCSTVPLARHLVDVSCYVAKPLGTWNRLFARGIDLLPPKYSTKMQIRTFQLSENLSITEITAMLITRWHKWLTLIEVCLAYVTICNPDNFTLDHCETLEWPVSRSVTWPLLTQDVLGRCKKRDQFCS